MDQQPALFKKSKGAVAHPVKQGFSIGSLQDGLERVAAMHLAHTMRDRQKMQIMVSKEALRGISQSHQASQCRQRVWPAIDSITKHDEPVMGWIEGDHVKHACEGCITALQIANQVSSHEFLE